MDPAEQTITIKVPSPTAWPMIFALGIALCLAGILTSFIVSAVGLCLLVAGAVGWFREVLPVERHEEIVIGPGEELPSLVRAGVAHLEVGQFEHRARLPLEIYPYSAGIKGGIAGGFVMAVLAALEGLFVHGSPWYTVNILAATVSSSLAQADTATLSRFSLELFLIALLIHGVLSLLMGLLYGLMLPTFPRHPAFFGGVVLPVLWTGLIWASLDVLNPVLDARIEWSGFIVCQIAFGLTAGFVTARSEKISTLQHVPFAMRMGVQAAGVSADEDRQ